jgi:DNA-binding XRE family transcriptional regulator
MKPRKTRVYSHYVLDSAELLGKLIQLGRKEKQWTEEQLAERVGISRATLQKIEKGDLKCEIGLVFEAAALTGVTLFEEAHPRLTMDLDLVKAKLALLPQSIRTKRKVRDDF